MGILKAIAGAVGGGLADSWLEVVEPDNMTATTVATMGVQVSNKRSSNTKGTKNLISNGSIVHVGVNQMMLLLDGGKIIDYSAEPGYYEVYLSSTPSMFNGELGDAIKETFSRIKFGGQPSASQQVVFINLQEIRGVKFGTRNALQYFDNFYNAELFVRCHGMYSIKITDPLKFYSEMLARNATHVDINDINEQLSGEFVRALRTAISKMSVDGKRISNLNAEADDLATYMNAALDAEWNEKRGLEVFAIGDIDISYDEESKKLINMRNQGAMLSDPTVREGYVQGSLARGMEAAGSNSAGAATAFMGMGMGMNATGNFMSAASATNAAQMQQIQQSQAQQLRPSQNAQALDDGVWTCECKQLNSGKFCSGCGKPKPAPAAPAGNAWTCTCGSQNTGKFCPSCGKPAPAANGPWTCACGNQNTGAFCSACGAKRP